MATEKYTFGRRSFLKSTLFAGGGLILGVNRLSAFIINPEQVLKMTDDFAQHKCLSENRGEWCCNNHVNES